MKTEIFHITDPEAQRTEVAAAAAILREGGLLGIPTETVYGLGANGLNAGAVRSIFEAKGRPQDNPLILHIPESQWLTRYCRNIPPAAYALAERFWPGPLTMILQRRENVPNATTGGLDTVGVRCPDHPVTLAIIRAAGVPVAAPSGNLSGRPSPTCAQHMVEDMDGRIEGIVDGGSCGVGVESTIIDLTTPIPRLLRPGGLPLESLREVLGEVVVDKAVLAPLAPGERARAPGMKYRHYAPKAPVTVVTGESRRTARYIRRNLRERTGVICFDEYKNEFPGCVVEAIGAASDKGEQARRVFDALRAFDTTDVTAIFAQCPGDDGLGLAIANRLKKAAGFQVVDLGEGRGMIIGITGPTGSGKTTALMVLRKRGYEVVDCDRLYYELLDRDQALRRALTEAFGPVFLPDGKLDRKALSARVFGDGKELARLNAIVYPAVCAAVEQKIQKCTQKGLVIDAINLIESGLGELCELTVAVTAPPEVRLKRIMARDGIDEERAKARIAAQKTDKFYRKNCAFLLENRAGSRAEFERLIDEFFTDLFLDMED